MATYVPGTGETNLPRIIQSIQQIGPGLDTANSNISAMQSAGIVTKIAGNSGAFTLNSTSGITNSTNDIVLQQASSSQFGAVKVDGSTITATGGVIKASLAPITSSLGADVLLNNTGSYFDGPSIAQGSIGTWFVSGSVMLSDTGGAQTFIAKLWDGTTVIASGYAATRAANIGIQIALSGYIASPAGNLRISVNEPAATTGKIIFNGSGLSKDSTISAFRIA